MLSEVRSRICGAGYPNRLTACKARILAPILSLAPPSDDENVLDLLEIDVTVLTDKL